MKMTDATQNYGTLAAQGRASGVAYHVQQAAGFPADQLAVRRSSAVSLLAPLQPTEAPAPSSVRREDLRPFSRKLDIYARESLNTSYGVANAAILSGMVGMGLANGGYMVLLQLLGTKGSSLPVVGFMTLTAFSMILSGASKTYTSHQRDNQDIGLLGTYRDEITASQYCRYFVRCGLATTGTNVALLAGTAAYAAGGMGANSLLALSVVSKSIEACLKGVELGYWNCIKTHLGNEQSQRHQRELNRTIVGIETITQALAFNIATMVTYIQLQHQVGDAAALRGVMLSLTLGCGIILTSNAYFSYLAPTLTH